MEATSIKQAAEYLREHDGYVVYCHANPDGDALGSAAALVLVLRAAGKKAVAFSPDGVPKKLDFIPHEGIFAQTQDETSNMIPLSVDLAGAKLLGGAPAPLFALSFDHHRVNTLECERLCLMSDRIATGEMIFLLAEELGVELSKDIADSLYTAICSDSGGFRYALTSAETHRIAARLHESGADFEYICRRLFECKSAAQVKLIKLAYNKLAFMRGGKCAYVAITAGEAEECGAKSEDFDCVNSIPREVDGVLVSAVVRAHKGGSKISLRSSGDVDVAAIAQKYGGGGHYHAAGISLDCEVPQAEEIVKKIFGETEL